MGTSRYKIQGFEVHKQNQNDLHIKQFQFECKTFVAMETISWHTEN